MKKLLKWLYIEFIWEPFDGARNLYLIAKGKKEPPEWITSKWDFKQIFKDTWIMWLMMILMFTMGWFMASQQHNKLINTIAEEQACNMIINPHISAVQYCNLKYGTKNYVYNNALDKTNSNLTLPFS